MYNTPAVTLSRSLTPVVAVNNINTVVEEGPEYEEIELHRGANTKNTTFDITSCPAYSSTIGQPTPQDYIGEEDETMDPV